MVEKISFERWLDIHNLSNVKLEKYTLRRFYLYQVYRQEVSNGKNETINQIEDGYLKIKS